MIGMSFPFVDDAVSDDAGFPDDMGIRRGVEGDVRLRIAAGLPLGPQLGMLFPAS